MPDAPTPIQTVIEVEQFLYHEARLLDERRFQEWLGLFTKDARYIVRYAELAEPGAPAGGRTRANNRPLVDDDLPLLTLRVKRLDTRLVHAEQPPSITRHFVSNVLVEPREEPDTFDVHANCLVSQVRPDVSEHTLMGTRHDVLRKVDGRWRIERREIVLDQATLSRTITIFF
jgi:3-phenylpropionate/cinnamic acid dioxygenase small subunit